VPNKYLVELTVQPELLFVLTDTEDGIPSESAPFSADNESKAFGLTTEMKRYFQKM